MYEHIVRDLDREITQLELAKSILIGGEVPKKPVQSVHRGGKRRMSSEGRARISAAQTKRWALYHRKAAA